MADDATFRIQILKTLKFEGGYANDPHDPGGETNFGISKRSYPDLDIKNLNIAQATKIYYDDYWVKPRINQLPDLLAGKVFDAGVNIGPGGAVGLLQNVANHAILGADLDCDGLIGKETLGVVNNNAELNLNEIAHYWKITNPLVLNLSRMQMLLELFRYELIGYYEGLVQQHPLLSRYLNGWLRRARA